MRFKNLQVDSLAELVAEDNKEYVLIEKLDLSEDKSDFGKHFADEVNNIKSDIIKLENGAEAAFVRSGNLSKDKFITFR